MHENLVNRYELNQFRAPALQPHVGLSNATIEGLLNMQERGTSFRVNAQPVQLKRKAPALVQPYAAAPAPYVDQAITDEQCHAHPYWLQFVQDSQYTQRASQMAKHEAVYKDALLEIPALPGKNPHRTIEAKLREAYPDNREYLGAYLEWVRIRDIQHAAETRKIHTIREAISATRATDTKRSSTEETSTFAARQDRIAQFQAPSMLVDIAMLRQFQFFFLVLFLIFPRCRAAPAPNARGRIRDGCHRQPAGPDLPRIQ
jgi:hypothetical protein